MCASNAVGVVELWGCFHWINADSLLTGGAPFPLNIGGLHGSMGHDQDQKLDCLECLEDLLPPVLSAFHAETVYPAGDAFFFQTGGEVSGVCFSVGAGVGDEDAWGFSRMVEASWHDAPSQRVRTSKNLATARDRPYISPIESTLTNLQG